MRYILICFISIVFFGYSQQDTNNKKVITNLYPGSKGWISKYVDLVNKGIISKNIGVNAEEDTLIIPFKSPTSFLFAKNVSDVFWTKKDKQKLWMFEVLWYTFRKFHNDTIQAPELFVNSLISFYDSQEDRFLFNKSDNEKLEKVINKRIKIKSRKLSNRWYTYEMSPLAYLDIVLFNEFLHTNIPLVDYPKVELDQYFYEYSKYIALIDDSISKEETRFLDLVKQSLRGSKLVQFPKKNDYLNYNTKPSFEIITSLFLTRYLDIIKVEMFACDGFISKKEQANLLDEQILLAKKLNDELELVQHSSWFSWKKEFKGTWKKVRKRNSYKFLNECHETSHLCALIGKSFHTKLSLIEKEERRSQLMDLAMVIPSAVVFIIPGGSVLLPLVVKLVPAFVPTSFRDNTTN